VPGVSAFVNLRSVIERPVGRVGVVHRPSFRGFIERQRALAAGSDRRGLRRGPRRRDRRGGAPALRSLRQSGIDALWVLNDNALLRDGQVLEEAWRPEIALIGCPGGGGRLDAGQRRGPLRPFRRPPPISRRWACRAANVLFELAGQRLEGQRSHRSSSRSRR
jgi:hypothetical protein